MRMMLNRPLIWRPASYHGHRKTHDFFEGWYFKLVDRTETRVYAVIPGVYLGKNGADSHCFVQTLDGLTGRSTFHRFPLAQFSAAGDRFAVCIGPNRFSADEISLDIRTEERQMQGRLSFERLVPWPVGLASPGIMGPYAFAPFMECYHGVVSLDHEIQGQLIVDGSPADFSRGRGYIEKDWGKSFPRAWIWMQTNHFEQPGTCLTGSVATIPWLGSAFRGFIVGLWHGGVLYRFATYSGASIKRLQLTDTHVIWHLAGRALGSGGALYRLEINAVRSEGGLLHAPYSSGMLQRVTESLTAQVQVRLLALREGGEEVIFAETGRHAGLEINGELGEILDQTTG